MTSPRFEVVAGFTRASGRTQRLALQVIEQARSISHSSEELARACKTLMEKVEGAGVGPWHCVVGTELCFAVRFRQHNLVTARERAPASSSSRGSSSSAAAPRLTVTLLRTGPLNASQIIPVDPNVLPAAAGAATQHLEWATDAAAVAVAAGCATTERNDADAKNPGNVFAAPEEVLDAAPVPSTSTASSSAPAYCSFELKLWSCSSVMSSVEREFCIAALGCAYRAQSDPVEAETAVMNAWKARLAVRYGPQWHAVAANHALGGNVACAVDADCGSYIEIAVVPRGKKKRALGRRFIAFSHLSPESSKCEMVRLGSVRVKNWVMEERVLSKIVYLPSLCFFGLYHYFGRQCEAAEAAEAAPRPDSALRAKECEDYASSWFFLMSISLILVICVKLLGILTKGARRKTRAAKALTADSKRASKHF